MEIFSWTEDCTTRIWDLNGRHRWSCYCINIGPTIGHNLMTWYCITLHCCITMTARNSLTQLSIRINSCIHRTRHTVYLKVLLLTCIRVVHTLLDTVKVEKVSILQIILTFILSHIKKNKKNWYDLWVYVFRSICRIPAKIKQPNIMLKISPLKHDSGVIHLDAQCRCG